MDSLSRAIMKEGLAQGREEMRQEMQKTIDDLNTMNTKMLGQTLAGIRVVRNSCGISYEEAMKRIGIPEADQAMYLELLQES